MLKNKILLITILIASCGGGGGMSSDSPNDPMTPGNAVTPCDTSNITNIILNSRNADCAQSQYVDNCTIAYVRDLNRALDFTANTSLKISSDMNSCTFSVDAIPNHDFNDSSASFATNVMEVNRSFTIKRNPVIVSENTQIDGRSWDAVMVNGVVVDIKSNGCYQPTEPRANTDGNIASNCPRNAEWNLVPLEYKSMFRVDMHNAHVQPDGTYHYHGNPNALFDDSPSEDGSPLIGWAADGFPIYGSYILEVSTGTYRKVLSGYTLKTGSRGTKSNTNPGGQYNGIYEEDWEWTNAGDLDECNGMTYKDQYGYYVTDGYPYIINCFKGTPDPSFNK